MEFDLGCFFGDATIVPRRSCIPVSCMEGAHILVLMTKRLANFFLLCCAVISWESQPVQGFTPASSTSRRLVQGHREVPPSLRHHHAVVVDQQKPFDFSPVRPFRRGLKQCLASKSKQFQDSVIAAINGAGAVASLLCLYTTLHIALWWNGLHCHAARALGVLPACFLTSTLMFTSVSFLTRFVAWNIFRRESTHNSERRLKIIQSVAPGINASVLASILMTTLVTYFCSPAAVHFQPVQFGYGEILRNSAAFALGSDALFYIIHRCMHQPRSRNPILKWLTSIHQQHHGTGGNRHDLIPHQGARSHFVEFLLNNLVVILPPLVLRSHPAFHFSYHLFSASTAWVMHSTFLCADNGMHTSHHITGQGNFGLAGFSDAVFGTCDLN